MIALEIGNSVRNIRKRQNIRMDHLAKSLGMSERIMRLYETGKRAILEEHAVMIAEKLHCSVEDLLQPSRIYVPNSTKFDCDPVVMNCQKALKKSEVERLLENPNPTPRMIYPQDESVNQILSDLLNKQVWNIDSKTMFRYECDVFKSVSLRKGSQSYVDARLAYWRALTGAKDEIKQISWKRIADVRAVMESIMNKDRGEDSERRKFGYDHMLLLEKVRLCELTTTQINDKLRFPRMTTVRAMCREWKRYVEHN